MHYKGERVIHGCHCTNIAAACMGSNKAIKIAEIVSEMFTLLTCLVHTFDKYLENLVLRTVFV